MFTACLYCSMYARLELLFPDADECGQQTAICSQKCNNTVGSYECLCDSRYYDVSSDNSTCVRRDKCSFENRSPHRLLPSFSRYTRGCYSDTLDLLCALPEHLEHHGGWTEFPADASCPPEDGHDRRRRQGLLLLLLSFPTTYVRTLEGHSLICFFVARQTKQLYYADIGANKLQRVAVAGGFPQTIQSFEVDGLEGIALDWVGRCFLDASFNRTPLLRPRSCLSPLQVIVTVEEPLFSAQVGYFRATAGRQVQEEALQRRHETASCFGGASFIWVSVHTLPFSGKGRLDSRRTGPSVTST